MTHPNCPTLALILAITSLDPFCIQNNSSKEPRTIQVENYLLAQQFDSALLILKAPDSLKRYRAILHRISQSNLASYAEYMAFIEAINKREYKNCRNLDNFILANIKTPDRSDEIDMDYVSIKWLQIRNLANELLVLDEASEQNEALNNYISQFNQNEPKTKKAKILASTHEIIIAEI